MSNFWETPEFAALSHEAKRIVLARQKPEFKAMSPEAQDMVIKDLEGPPKDKQVMSRFMHGLATGAGNQLVGLGRLGAGLVSSPKETIKQQVVGPMVQMHEKAKGLRAQGKETQAGLYNIAGFVPLLGPAAAQLTEQTIEAAKNPQGDLAGAIGQDVAFAAPILHGLAAKAAAAKMPSPPPMSLSPTLLESSPSMMAEGARVLARTPIAKGSAMKYVQERAPLIQQEAFKTAQELSPPIPPIMRMGEIPPRATAIPETRGLGAVTEYSPMEAGRGVAQHLITKAASTRETLSKAWEQFVPEMKNTFPDLTQFRKITEDMLKLPQEAREFLVTTISPEVLNVMVKGKGKATVNIDELLGQTEAVGQSARLLELNPDIANVQANPVSWGAIKEARTQVGRLISRERSKAAYKETPTSHVLGRMYSELTNIMKKDMTPEQLAQFEALTTAEKSFYERYTTGIADDIIQGTLEPSVAVDTIINKPIEQINKLMDVIEDPVYKNTLRQGMLNRVLEESGNLEIAFKRLLGPEAKKWQELFPNEYEYLVNAMGNRLQRGLFEDLLAKSMYEETGVLNGPMIADLIKRNREQFIRYGATPEKLAAVENFGKKMEPLNMPNLLGAKRGGLASSFHSYFQINKFTQALLGLFVGMWGMPKAGLGAHPLVALAPMAMEKMLVNIFMHPEGTTLMNRILYAAKPSPQMANWITRLGYIAAGETTFDQMSGRTVKPSQPSPIASPTVKETP